MKRLTWLAALAALGLGAAVQPHAAASSIYWTETGGIHRAELDGSNVGQIADAWLPSGVTLDLPAGKVYWTDDLPVGGPFPVGVIMRANLDGSNVEDLVSQSGLVPSGVALWPDGGKMYWTSGSEIRRANLDGSELETVVEGLTATDGIALDRDHDKVYWTHSEIDLKGLIQRANLDGSEVENLVPDGFRLTTGIALDLPAEKIYWGFIDPNIDGLFPGSILRANLDGSNVEYVIFGLSDPRGIALDPVPGKVYWSDTGYGDPSPLGELRRANLDGSEVETLLTGLRDPRGIAIDPTPIPEPATLSLLALGGLAILRRRRR